MIQSKGVRTSVCHAYLDAEYQKILLVFIKNPKQIILDTYLKNVFKYNYIYYSKYIPVINLY